MIDNKIEELFNTIEESKEYKEYKKIEKILDKDKSIKKIIEEIKALQQESVRLEYEKNDYYKVIDKEIDKKAKELNDKPVYQEYLTKMNELNNILSMSSKMIEDYIDDKVN